jgi:2,5-diamino-6-(ribosylamino)-4(3H)-pyrimidinone 5'-phosphate reductase
VNRPFVYVNMAMTADGKITSAAREYPKFTTPHDRRTMDRLRAEADAVLVGAGTLRADDPPLHVRDPEMQRHRASLGKPPGLLNVLVTASASVDPDSGFFTHGSASGRIVATVEDAPPELVARLRERAEVWALGTGSVDLPLLCERLKARGVERLLVEGGGELNWGFVREDLVDEIYVTIAPALLGGRTAPTWLEGDGFPMAGKRTLELADVARVGSELYTRWKVVRA